MMHCPTCKHEIPPESEICTNCDTSVQQDNPQVAIGYFGIATLRLFLLATLTLGIYRLYWFYRNWIVIKKQSRSISGPCGEHFSISFFAIVFLKGLINLLQAINIKSAFHLSDWRFIM